MEKYIEILDSLMKAKKEKKKKEPTIKEKEAFRSAWLSLVADAGLTGSAEQFLYEGFAFCGAEPFYAYLIQTEDQNATLAAMFSGKYRTIFTRQICGSELIFREGYLWQMCIHLNSEATICPASETRIQNQRNWSESTYFHRDFGIVKMIAASQENQISYCQNIKRSFS